MEGSALWAGCQNEEENVVGVCWQAGAGVVFFVTRSSGGAGLCRFTAPVYEHNAAFRLLLTIEGILCSAFFDPEGVCLEGLVAGSASEA